MFFYHNEIIGLKRWCHKKTRLPEAGFRGLFLFFKKAGLVIRASHLNKENQDVPKEHGDGCEEC